MGEEHRTPPQDESSGAEEAGSSTDGTPGDPPERWWITPAAFGAAAALLILAAFSPWSWGLSEDFGTVPWWVAIPALVAAVLLVGGLGARRTVRWAVAAAALTACLGLFAFARSPAEELPHAPVPYQFLAADPPRPAAALAAALTCLAAIGLCVLLARRQGFRLPPPAAGGTRRRAQRLLAVVVGGALVGSLLSVGTDQIAQSVQQALADKKPVFDATSQTLPEERRGKGHDVSAAEHHEPVPHLKPEKTLWRKKLPGPVELTTCVLDRPKDDGWRVDKGRRDDPLVTQSTLVAVESVSGGNAVVGYDAADGSERWRYTVRDTEITLPRLTKTYPADSRLGQVGVSDFCRVHAVVDPLTLVTLDGSTGEVKNTTQLPSPAAWKDRNFNWHFVTGSHSIGGREDKEAQWQPLVPLGHADQIYVQTSRQLAEVDHWTGKVLAVTEEEKGCWHLATHERRSARTINTPLVLAQGCTSPYYIQIPGLPFDQARGVDATELAFDGLSRLISHRQGTIPRLGCDRVAPRISDFRDSSKGVVVVGRWCDDYDGPLLVGSDDYDYGVWETVVELPEDTELPLRPYASGFGDVLWLSHGSLYRLEPARSDGPGSYQKVYAEDGEPLEALVPPATRPDDATVHEYPGAFYAVTASGTLLTLTYGEKEGKERGAVAKVAGRMAKAAGECAGTRDLLVDRAGVKLLALCETGEGTEVTAITGERLTKAERTFPLGGRYKQHVSH